MIRAGIAALLLLAFGDGDGDRQPAARPAQGTITVHQQIIIRVQAGPGPVATAAPPVLRWEEHRGPRCVDPRRIVGALFPGPDSVDFILRDNSRIRARLDRRCPALAFYRNFYLTMNEDGRICADRDSLRSRIGGECQIDQFRTLRAAAP
jgi:hypothetical protein